MGSNAVHRSTAISNRLHESDLEILPDQLCQKLAVVVTAENVTLEVNPEIELCAAKSQTTPGFEPWTMGTGTHVPTPKFTKTKGAKNVNQTNYFGGTNFL